jgi:GH25 family lysozyme M1 (1,4-beta-N-acetylmuramidase)
MTASGTPLIYPNSSGTTSIPLTGTSFTLPSGYLVNGHTYRWDMTSFVNSTEGTSVSSTLYFQAPSSTTPTALVFGVDVSTIQQQYTIDWLQVAKDSVNVNGQNYPITFAYIRASKGKADVDNCEFLDPEFGSGRAQDAAIANIKVGVYHVAGVENVNTGAYYLAKDEADFFVSVAGNYIKPGFMRPALDVEDNSCGNPRDIGWASLATWVDDWMQEVYNLTQVWPILYCSDDYRTQLGVYLSQKYDLWDADYTYDPTTSPNSSPWSSSIFYQSDDLASIIGISKVDMDVFQGTLQDFQSKLISNPGMPVELSSFTASESESQVLLTWRTETEVQDYGFDIERRSMMDSSLQWNKIGFVAGSGTSNSPHKYFYTDQELSLGKYAYRLKQIDRDGAFEYYGNVEVIIDAPKNFSLEQNYPNPFNPTTTIRYVLPQNSNVKIEIFNTLGQQVVTLVSGEMNAGIQQVQWNAGNVASGIYFYRLNATPEEGGKPFVEVKKMQVIK